MSGPPADGISLAPLVSMIFSGASLTEHDELAPGRGSVGRPVWSATQLLEQLELRLGLPRSRVSKGARLQMWSRRLAEHETTHPGQFYARSYALDTLGTAESLLAWRDELVMSGWNGEEIAGGGERLSTFAALEAGLTLAPGTPDRLRLVQGELQSVSSPLFTAVQLTEMRTLWPLRWRIIFDLLAAKGTQVATVFAELARSDDQSDLGHLQAVLRGEQVTRRALRNDGSITLLCAETSWELGDATAALLRSWRSESAAVIRVGDARALDVALVAQGLASQGLTQRSHARPALQVLPLAVELAFEPRDPARVMELLSLPVGPFSGQVGRTLARALSDAPGIGGPAWRAAKEKVVEDLRKQKRSEESIQEHLTRLGAWLETPGYDAVAGSSRSGVLEIALRVTEWLRRRLAGARISVYEDPEDARRLALASVLASALVEASAFQEALAHESRERLDLVDCRLLLEQVLNGHSLHLATERCGRVDHADAPAGVRSSRDVIVWWHCVSGTEWRPPARPWRAREMEALSAAGVELASFPDRLAADARGWQQAVLAARKRLVLAVPRWSRGESHEPHPVWHEIAARLRATRADLAAMTMDARDVRALGKMTLQQLGVLALPPARAVWKVDPALLPPAQKHSATSLEALLGCPLKWVLQYPAALRGGSVTSIASGPLLNGKLGHRVVEELHRTGKLAAGEELAQRIEACIDRLLREEAAPLLRAGMSFERAQLRRQLTSSIRRLVEMLGESDLEVVDVEVSVEGSWRGAALNGRIDLLARDKAGRDVVVDLKWGGSSYRDLLAQGRATQLAVYAAARKMATGADATPAAAYFSLGSGKTMATPGGPFRNVETIKGADAADTWQRMERTAASVEEALARGEIVVSGVAGDSTLLHRLGIAPGEHVRHVDAPSDAACKYCDFGAVCGRQWSFPS